MICFDSVTCRELAMRLLLQKALRVNLSSDSSESVRTVDSSSFAQGKGKKCVMIQDTEKCSDEFHFDLISLIFFDHL